MKYFKIKFGFNNQDFIRIDETELDRAMYSQITSKVGVFKNGTVRGSNIISITPDIHREMNWNDGYEFQPEDFADIRRVEKKYEGVIGETKSRVENLIQTKQEHLIGKQQEQLT